MPQKTSPFRQAQIEALAALDTPTSKIAEVVGVNLRTVQRILAEHRGYNDPQSMTLVRDEIKQAMEKRQYEVADSLLERVNDTKDNANTRDAAYAFNVLRNQSRLDAGEATQNVNLHTRLGPELSNSINATLERISKVTLRTVNGEAESETSETNETNEVTNE